MILSKCHNASVFYISQSVWPAFLCFGVLVQLGNTHPSRTRAPRVPESRRNRHRPAIRFGEIAVGNSIFASSVFRKSYRSPIVRSNNDPVLGVRSMADCVCAFDNIFGYLPDLFLLPSCAIADHPGSRPPDCFCVKKSRSFVALPSILLATSYLMFVLPYTKYYILFHHSPG